MYNLTVADVHIFAVGEGAWVVHNTTPLLPPPDAPYGLLPPPSNAAQDAQLLWQWGKPNNIIEVFDKQMGSSRIDRNYTGTFDISLGLRDDLQHFSRTFQSKPTAFYMLWPAWMSLDFTNAPSLDEKAGVIANSIDKWASRITGGRVRFNMTGLQPDQDGLTVAELKYVSENYPHRTSFYKPDPETPGRYRQLIGHELTEALEGMEPATSKCRIVR